MNIHEKTYYNLKQIEETVNVLIQELETAKVKKNDIDKVKLILTKCQSAKQHFNDK